MLKTFASMIVLALAANSASAITTDVTYTIVDNSHVLSGYRTWDIYTSFTGQLTGIQMLTDLTSGSIYQHVNGGTTAPPSGFFGFVPPLEYDSFVTLGGLTAETDDASPGIAGGAVNLGGASSATFSTSMIDITHFPPGGTVISNRTDYVVARITFSDDARGTLKVGVWDADNQPLIQTFNVPEPASLGLLGLGALPLLRRRRCA